jgi:hypothetical protein
MGIHDGRIRSPIKYEAALNMGANIFVYALTH